MTMTITMEIYDRNGDRIDTDYCEKREQDHANLFVLPDDVVLELGARYGSVSVVINRKLSNPLNHVAVDPDFRVWDCLKKNRDINNCKFHILKGAISKKPVALALEDNPDYGTMTVSTSEPTSVPTYTLEEVQDLYGLKFTTLIADCEGFLGTFFEENPWMYDQLNTVLYEADQPQVCDYDVIAKNLREHGFTLLWYGFHWVWKRYPLPGDG